MSEGLFDSFWSPLKASSDQSSILIQHLRVALVEHLKARGFALLDVQQDTPHSRRMGATAIPRPEFLRRLRRAVRLPVTFGDPLERRLEEP